MVSTMGIPAIRSEWGNWHLLFATQPEPDLEFTEGDLDESTSPPPPPMNAPKRSGKKPLLWILLLLLLGGIGYVAMDPDAAMQLVEPYLGGDEDTAPPAPKMPPATAQTPKAAPTVAPPTPPVVADRTPSAPAEIPAPPSAPVAALPTPTTPAPAAPALKPTAPAAKPAAPAVYVAGPLYAEGQRVTVIADPTRPKSPIPLFVDAVGTKTSTTVLAGATLTILDGDYQKRGWVYSVRAQNGRKGWVPERSLRLKR